MAISRSCLKAEFPVLLVVLQLVFIVVFWFFVDYSPTAETSAFTSKTTPAEALTMRAKLLSKVATNKNRYPLFQDVHIMIFVGFGFLMTFLRRYSFSAVSLNLLISAFIIQWALFLRGCIGNHDGMKFMDVTKMIYVDFDCATVLISFGAVLGKVSPVQLLLMALMEVPLVIVNIWLTEEKYFATDVGGSMILHTFGAYFGVACATALARKENKDHHNNESNYNSDIFSMIGTVFLWCYWPTFNSILVGSDGAERAIMNTYLSLTASTVMTFALSTLSSPRGKFKMVLVQNATLAGGVAVGSVANFMLHPAGALLVGTIAGIVSVFGFSILQGLLEKIGVHDTCGVHNLHGMPGIVAGIASVVATLVATENAYGSGLYSVFPMMAPHNGTTLHTISGSQKFSGMGRDARTQALYQLATLGTSFGIAVGGGLVTGLILRLPIWDQVPSESLFSDEPNFELPEEGGAKEKEGHDNHIYVSKF